MSSPEAAFSEEIGPAVEQYYERHLAVAKPWAVHDVIDWGTGVSFKDKPWSEDDYPLPAGVRSAVHVNLLTEDNAPYYTSLLLSRTPADHPLQAWNGQWTMEEGQHSSAIRTWALMSRAVDPELLEAGRRIQMSKGVVPQPATLADMLAYVPFQEAATRVAHRNTAGELSSEDKTGKKVLALVAGDEGRHYNFYRDVAAAGLEIDPSMMVLAIAHQVINFKMPGTGIPHFNKHAVRIAREGIYGVSHFRNDVVVPTLRAWDLEHIEGLDADAQKALEKLYKHFDKLQEIADRQAERWSSSSDIISKV